MVRRRMWFYCWVTPLLWAVISRTALEYPGDEYGVWGVGSLAGLWILFLASPGGDVRVIAWYVLAAGVAVMALSGWVLDVLRVPRRAWLAVWIAVAFAICVASIASHGSYRRAIAKNGSLATYVLFSLNFGSYVSWPVLAALGVAWRPRRPRSGHCAGCGYDLTGNESGRCPECGIAARGG